MQASLFVLQVLICVLSVALLLQAGALASLLHEAPPVFSFLKDANFLTVYRLVQPKQQQKYEFVHVCHFISPENVRITKWSDILRLTALFFFKHHIHGITTHTKFRRKMKSSGRKKDDASGGCHFNVKEIIDCWVQGIYHQQETQKTMLWAVVFYSTEDHKRADRSWSLIRNSATEVCPGQHDGLKIVAVCDCAKAWVA